MTHRRRPRSHWTRVVGGQRHSGLSQSVSGKDARAVDERCKHQSRFRGERVSPTPRILPVHSKLTLKTKQTKKKQPTEQPPIVISPALVRRRMMSPVKPLQCRSVTTHLFSQPSLASLSDCSLSSHIPALEQICLPRVVFFAVYTYLFSLSCRCLGALRPDPTQT